jgi:hypothetical protein
MSGAVAAVRAMAAATQGQPEVVSLQEIYARAAEK